MNDTLGMREITDTLRRFWWLPVMLALVGAGIGLGTSTNLDPVHRSQGTILVGSTNGAVTRSTTIRASESLAAFYADLARRQLVLQPVVEQLGLDRTWTELSSQVSAAVPSDNPRLLVITVSDADQRRSSQVARAVVQQVVSLSPSRSDEDKVFVDKQAAMFKRMIQDGQRSVAELQERIAETSDPRTGRQLRSRLTRQTIQLDDWRRTYVALISAEPTSDAGALQVLDEVVTVTDMARPTIVVQAGIGALAGGAVGLLLAHLLYRRRGRRSSASPSTPDHPVGVPRTPEQPTSTAVASSARDAWREPKPKSHRALVGDHR